MRIYERTEENDLCALSWLQHCPKADLLGLIAAFEDLKEALAEQAVAFTQLSLTSRDLCSLPKIAGRTDRAKGLRLF